MNGADDTGARRAKSGQPLVLLVVLQGLVSAASLVVEIVAGRMLAPYVGMSLYTWTSVIAVVLAGFSAGHWAGGRIAERDAAAALRLTAFAMAAASAATGFAVYLLRWSAGAVLGAAVSPGAAIVTMTMAAFFLPSFFAGVPAPVLAHLSVAGQKGREGRALGAMFASGALGAIAGTLAAGFLFISWLGSIRTLAVIAALYAFAGLVMLTMARRPGARAVAIVAAAALAGLSGLSAQNPCTRESDYFCIRVEDVSPDGADTVRLMALDHLVHGISARNDVATMHTAHAALMDQLARLTMADRTASGRKFSAFFIGGGTYSMPRAWTADGIADVTVAEIDPAVTAIAVSDFWFDPASARVLSADARAALAGDKDRYDVIVGDAFTDIAIPPHLVTAEFFALARGRLNPGGVYIMNVIDHIDRMGALAAIVATLETSFPVVEIWTRAEADDGAKRRVFILLAGDRASPGDRFVPRAPEHYEAVRLTAAETDALFPAGPATLLTDDYTPIDRLMGLDADGG
ncbi:MAG: fused MFS/spermidine synthase [Phyllobacteriaceae bacterium]|nr:fused MFS/spermidine synthase [Phyllobacteriaceae bacterium]